MAANHKRGPWSQDEDQVLLNLVEVHGAFNWVLVSSTLGSRSAKQCRERFHQNLKANLRHDPITEEEGQQIDYLVATIGKRWAEIARRLSNRSDNAVKNWWNGNQNRRKKRKDGQRALTDNRYNQMAPTEGQTRAQEPLPPYSSRPSLPAPLSFPNDYDRRTSWPTAAASLPSPCSVGSAEYEMMPNYVATPEASMASTTTPAFASPRDTTPYSGHYAFEHRALPPIQRHSPESEQRRLPPINEFLPTRTPSAYQNPSFSHERTETVLAHRPRYDGVQRKLSDDTTAAAEIPTAPTTPESQQQWRQPIEPSRGVRDPRLSLNAIVD